MLFPQVISRPLRSPFSKEGKKACVCVCVQRTPVIILLCLPSVLPSKNNHGRRFISSFLVCIYACRYIQTQLDSRRPLLKQGDKRRENEPPRRRARGGG